MKLLICDVETYYDKTYSLKSMTTEEYIRHPMFEVIGVAVQVGDGEPEWFSGTMKQTKRWLAKFDWANSIMLAHNTMFDAAILNWHFDIRPKMLADTMCMARALHGPNVSVSLKSLAELHHVGVKGDEVVQALGKRRVDFDEEEMERYGSYCRNDVRLTYDIFNIIAPNFPPVEAKLIDLTLRMFVEPSLHLDKTVLTDHLMDVQAKKEALMSRLNYEKADLMSNPKLAELLEFHGVKPPMKVSPTTGKETFAFAKNDEEFKALMEHENPQVQAIVAARVGVKSTLEETRTERFLGVASRGTLPVPLKYYGARTGRWSGEDYNLQNLPRNSMLKKAIKAPEGYVLVDCDSSQIEARVLAWMAQQSDLVDFFGKNNAEIAAGVPKNEMQFDPYRIMASQIYGVAVNHVTSAQRQVGKVVLLGAGYGLGWRKFLVYASQQGIVVDDDFAKQTIDIYRATFPMIPKVWKEGDTALEAIIEGADVPLGRPNVLKTSAEGIKLPNGLYIPYPNLRRAEYNGKAGFVYDTKRGKAIIPKGIWGGGVTENWAQALARIIIGDQMLMIAKRYKTAMTVHDSVVALIPEEEVVEGVMYVEACMRIRPKWATGLPLNCESHVGVSYGG